MRGKLAIAGALGGGLATIFAALVVGASSFLAVPGLVLAAIALLAGLLGSLVAVVSAPLLLGSDASAPSEPEASPERVRVALEDLVAGRYSEVRLPAPADAPELAGLLADLAAKLTDDRRTSLTRENELREKLNNEATLRHQAEQDLKIEQAAAVAGGVGADAAADAFLARMSHELRTPLNAVLGYSEMLLEEAEDEESRDDLGRIRSATLNLLAMVTSVLDLTQLQSGDFEVRPERVVVADTVQQVIDATRLDAESRGNEVVVDVPQKLVGSIDRRMMHSILFNLVANACKYTERGKVRIVARNVTGGRIRIQVEDDGIGMTERQIAEAFQPFRQADGSFTRRYDGSGLGLAVVRGFAEAMGGTIKISSQLGQGATVSVEIPREVTPRAAQPVFDEDEPTMLLR